MGLPSNDCALLAAVHRRLATTLRRSSAASFGSVRIFAAEGALVFLFIAACVYSPRANRKQRIVMQSACVCLQARVTQRGLCDA